MAKKSSGRPLMFWFIMGLGSAILIFLLILRGSSIFYPQPKYDFEAQKSVIDSETQNVQILNQAESPKHQRAAAVFTDSPGGSGTFYYVMGASTIEGKIVYSNPEPIGDRISVEDLTVLDPDENNNGIIDVKILDRPENAPMSETPSVEKNVLFEFLPTGNLKSVN